jgi:hypothetical protein
MAFLNDDDILLIEKNTGRVICIIRTINELKELSLCF